MKICLQETFLKAFNKFFLNTNNHYSIVWTIHLRIYIHPLWICIVPIHLRVAVNPLRARSGAFDVPYNVLKVSGLLQSNYRTFRLFSSVTFICLSAHVNKRCHFANLGVILLHNYLTILLSNSLKLSSWNVDECSPVSNPPTFYWNLDLCFVH